MTTKVKIIIAVVTVAAAFSAGRWLAPTKVVTETKTVTVVQTVDKTKTDTNQHKTIVITQKPDGTKQTVITDDKSSETKAVDTTNSAISTDTRKTVERDDHQVTISALGAINIHSLSSTPAFGGIISRPLLGPVNISVFGLSNGIGGMGIGLTF